MDRSFEQIIIFVRAPRLGEVKTRLAARIGPAKALEAYNELLRRTISATKAFPHIEVRYTPDDAGADVAPLLQKGWTSRSQGDGSLGERLIRAFHDGFKSGAGKIAIIGSDCPYLVKKDFQNCWTSLNQNDLVLGPATDGGYWLIGLKKLYPELFQEIAWSTSDVLAQTLARGKALGLQMDLLRILSDVDTEEDWNEYVQGQTTP